MFVQQRLARDLWIVGRATIIGQIIGVATSVSLRWLLDPAALGVWQSLRLFLSYGNYLNLGASKGAARELSVATGRGNVQAVTDDLHTAHTLNLLSSLAFAVVLAGASWWCSTFATATSAAWSMGLAFLAIFVVLHRQITFHITLLRAEQRFDTAARQSVYEGLAALLLGTAGAWLAGLPGLLGATLLVAGASLVYLQRHATFRLSWTWDRSRAARLIGIGGPILLTGAFTTLFRSIDRLTLLACSPTAAFDVGCYSTALLVGSQLYGLASITGTVASPKLAQLFGATNDTPAVSRFAAETTLTQLLWLTPLGASAIVIGPTLLGALFPAYHAGLAALPAVVVATLLATVALNGSNVLIAIGEERAALRGLIVSTLITSVAMIVAAVGWPSVTGVASAACVGNLVYAATSGYAGLWRRLPHAERRVSLTLHALTLLPILGVAIVLEQLSPGVGDRSWLDMGNALVKLIVVGAVSLIVALTVSRAARRITVPDKHRAFDDSAVPPEALR
ncbi:MAG: oligosaccharide flippase family protein [Planctomycetaceae bacterium]|nr:oligosaccharide flippase family protein [Planctomycetaceae bacterium]